MNNIMMLHNGRCGSTVVGNLLAQNPNMHWLPSYIHLYLKNGKKNTQIDSHYQSKKP